MTKTTFNIENLKATNAVVTRLNLLRRWTYVLTEDKYNELAKQALNCISSYIVASYCEESGMLINWERFPKIALYRAFQKAYVNFDTPEITLDAICEEGRINKDAITKATNDIIEKRTSSDFAEFVCSGVGTLEMDIYRAASKVATLAELFETNAVMYAPVAYSERLMQIQRVLSEYQDIPGIKELADTNGNLFKLLRNISRLRNQNRWAVHAYTMECSVLGHLFDTAIWAYYIGMEGFEDEQLATEMFFMGVFHDLAEVWTTDIPSPVKDSIPGFRTATEKFELKMLDENLYSLVPVFLEKKLRKVMFEEVENVAFKKLMKAADYLSADSECWRQYFKGSRDIYFLGAIGRTDKKIQNESICITPNCRKLHDLFKEYSENICRCLPDIEVM